MVKKGIIDRFKAAQKENWRMFAPIELVTTISAAQLIQFSQISAGDVVLDVGCGTGVVAITAARLGADVSALDLSSTLLEKAELNCSIAKVSVNLMEGDVENLPYPDHFFDAVLSQFGHMFAPQPKIAIREMLRVLKPEGIIAFSTWPTHLFVGRLFDLVYRFYPPPPGISSPSQWGDPNFIREQLGNQIKNLTFDQDIMRSPILSLDHYLLFIETGPVLRCIKYLKQNAPDQLEQFREEIKKLAQDYFSNNYIHQHFLLTRAQKKS